MDQAAALHSFTVASMNLCEQKPNMTCSELRRREMWRTIRTSLLASPKVAVAHSLQLQCTLIILGILHHRESTSRILAILALLALLALHLQGIDAQLTEDVFALQLDTNNHW
jgi:hypothetical protein